MNKVDFKVVNENGSVSIVRIKSGNSGRSSQPTQRMKVMCFDSAQIDRIFSIQEKAAKDLLRK